MLAFVILVSVLWLIGNIFTRLGQDFFIFRFAPLAESATLHFELPHEEIRLPGVGGGVLAAVYFQRPVKRGAVLFFHGNRGNVSRWGHLAKTFAAHDFDVLIPDYRGYGRSSGPRSEKIFYEDAAFWYRWMLARYSSDKIVLYGRSLGSAPATFLASRHPCAKLILETPFSSMRNLFYTYYPFLPPVFFFKYRFDNETALREVTCPVQVFAGRRDYVVPFRCTKRLLPWLKPGDVMTVIEAGGHNNLATFSIYQEALRQALLPIK